MLSPFSLAVKVQPPTVFTGCMPASSLIIFLMADDSAFADTTWQVRILVSCALFSGFSRVSTVPAGSLLNAALVGANTVKGPSPDNVSTRPAAFTAATSVVWSFELTAFWMMFFDGYIGAPPTVTVFSAAKLGTTAFIARLSAKTAAPAKASVDIRFMALSVALFAVPEKRRHRELRRA